MKSYDHKKIEKKWQRDWDKKGIYKTKENPKQPKQYVLDMFPYPSGEGLHVGHPKGYIATDIYSRFKKMNGENILHPMGWDAFGLPAENFAIKNKVHPRKSVEKNIKRYKEQLSIIGFNYDWSREINTTDPEYYKWTQWIFLQLLKKGLAFESFEPINWCPSCQTGLANEDLEDGKCERCGSVVEKKPMRQWVLKITDYADRLLNDLNSLNWPESIKESQRNWIGKSEGAEINFKIEFEGGQKPGSIPVFTTRPDTIFGATAFVFSPEHVWVTLALDENHKGVLKNADAVRKYVEKAKAKTEIERTDAKKEKTGIKLEGVWAVNPANQEKIPIFVADYVLPTYGTGAVMAVPAHDKRDFEFAKKYNLPIKEVIESYFVQTKEPGIYRENEPIVPREGIITIIKHWSEDKYICLEWKKVAWKTFLTGGIENGQTAEQAGIAEIKEETGFLNPKFIKELGVTHGLFYHVPKKENRLVHGHVIYFELQNDEKEEISAEENDNHTVTWLTLEELKEKLTPATHQYSLRMFKGDLEPWTDDGILKDSGKFTRMHSSEARKAIVEFVKGKFVIRYKLRDWVFSRQRYWGEPIPVIHCEKCGVVAVPEKDLPVKLPEVKNYAPTGTGESPLAAIEKWVNVKCPTCKGKAKRETNTMPQWAGSCWYYLRYMDPKNKKQLVDPKKEKYWNPVDVYVGGAEHATRHLIYARFWHKFLYDIGAVSTQEPFMRLHNVGLILAEDGKKMSKRYGNVINPDDVVNTYGADTFRIYEMFIGPFSQSTAWNTSSIIGSRRFVERIWKIQEKVQINSKEGVVVTDKEFENLVHNSIKKVTEDIENFAFNTAISTLMILINGVDKRQNIGRENYETILKLLAPFAPHISEELWRSLGYKTSIHLEGWPKYDPIKIESAEVNVVVQVNGKVRDSVTIKKGSSEREVKDLSLKSENVKKWLNGKEIRKVVYVQDRLINYVIG